MAQDITIAGATYHGVSAVSLKNTDGVEVIYSDLSGASGIIKSDGAGQVSTAVEGTDYESPTTVNAKINRATTVNVADANYTTLMARGESLNSTETTPAVNGAIAWTYS